MKFLLAKKANMTQIFTEEGVSYPVTILNFEPMVVTQIKNKEKDGYDAVQFGTGKAKEKNLSKPVKGHLKDLGHFKNLIEYRTDGEISLNKGDKIGADVFGIGDKIEVSALSKAKGFQGVVKRHGFAGGPRTHGQKHSEREPGSIGGGGRDGGRVAKGMRMAGRMGGERVTVKGLKVLKVDLESGELFVSGAVPGRRGTLVEVKGN